MKILSVLFAAWLAGTAVSEPTETKKIKGDFAPVAVLELFTSQGCSSCPPADALLNKTIKENHSGKIIGLSFHISYWNHLGWADPYSSEAYSKRQSWYSSNFTSGVYTPQVVVNGTDEYVGSNKSAAETKIKEALAKPATVAIDLSLADGKLTYHLSGQYANALLNVAVVQDEATNFVKRGENGGRQLIHNNVVLSLTTQKTTADTGEIKLQLPNNASRIIVYVQNGKNEHIVGASQLEIN
jgi:hypothetical protein